MSDVMDDMIDIGDGNFVKLIPSAAGGYFGFATYHLAPDGSQCGGIQEFSPNGWELKSIDPVSIVPSFRCSNCPAHFYITKGKAISCD